MAKPKIMVVDDDVDYVESTAAVLGSRGYEVIAAHDGKEGMEKAKSELPQLIIIDLMMNTINEGYDFCLEIRKDKRFKNIPLLMISSAHQNEMFKDLNFVPDDIWFPIDTFLDKPVNADTLLEHVNRLVK